MIRLWSALRAIPARIALLIVVAFAVLIPLGFALERVLMLRLVDARLTDMEAALAREMGAGRARIKLAEERVARLAQLIGDADGKLDVSYAADFDRSVERAPDGALRMVYKSGTTYSGTMWIPASVHLTTHQKALMARSREIVSQLGAGTIGETSDDVWFMLPDGSETVYVPNDPEYGTRDTPSDYAPSRWIDPILPQNNPGGGPKWVPSQSSPVPPIWYGSVLAPVKHNGILLGTAGLDFVIGQLVENSAWRPHSAGSAELIVDLSRASLIAHGVGAEFGRARTDSLTVNSLPSPVRDSLQVLIERVRRAKPESVLRGSVGDRILLASALEQPEWVAVVVIERDALVAPLRAPLRLVRVSLGFALALLTAALLGAMTADVRRERAIADLRARASERFNRLFQMLPVAVALTRAEDGTLVEANDVARRLMGEGEQRGLHLWSDPEETARVRRIIAEQGYVSEYAGKFRAADGRERDVLMSARIIELEGTPHVLTAVQDTSEQRRLEAQLLQSQKLEAVGRLAGGVAHDFNNLLTAVMGYCDILARTFAPNDSRMHDVGEIRAAAKRGAALTRQLLGFARKQTHSPREVEVNSVIRGLLGMLRRLLSEQVRITTDLDAQAGTVLIDPGQLEQVITNLAVNARDAMPEGGPLAIRTRRDDNTVILELTDAGVGIPAHVKEHIFEPFFTTKEVGQGSGLGLATCYGIVNQAGGSIRCFDAPGRGTTFQVQLPRVGEPSDAKEDAATVTPAKSPNGKRRILLVEDDEMVRDVTRTVLEHGGYDVEAVAGAPEALTHLIRDDALFDLVVTDIVMPHMSGTAFARVLASTHPRMPILFMSGYAAEDGVRAHITSLGHEFLAKPYTTGDLLDAAERSLTNVRR